MASWDLMSTESRDSIRRFKDITDVIHKRKKKSCYTFYIWSSRRISLQCYITISLGLGNMLQFTTAVSYYGGVIWIPYVICVIMIGIPLVIAELALAHYISKDIRQAWEMTPLGFGIFINSLVATFALTAFTHLFITNFMYAVIELEWISPRTYWQWGKNCSNTIANASGEGQNCQYLLPDVVWLNEYQNSSEDGKYEWLTYVLLTIVSFLTFIVNRKGAMSLEKFTIIFVLVPYLSSVILLIVMLTLPRPVHWIKRCFQGDWAHMADLAIWVICFKRAIIGFAIGNLSLTFTSIHSDFNNDIMVDVVIVCLTQLLSTFLFSFIILGLMGNFSQETKPGGLPAQIQDYMTLTLWLVQGILSLPNPNWFWTVIFVTFLLVCAFGEMSFMFASIGDAVICLIPKLRGNMFAVALFFCLIFYLTGIIMIISKITKLPSLDSSFTTIAFLQSFTIFWIYSYQRVCADYHFLMGYKPSLFLQFTWVISPLAMATALLITLICEKNIDLLVKNAVVLTGVHIVIFFITGIIQVYTLKKNEENYNVFRSNKNWGPSDPLLQKSRLIFNSRIITEEHIYRQKLYKRQLAKPYDITDQNIVQLL